MCDTVLYLIKSRHTELKHKTRGNERKEADLLPCQNIRYTSEFIPVLQTCSKSPYMNPAVGESEDSRKRISVESKTEACYVFRYFYILFFL